MRLTSEQFNKALAEFQLFGPRRRIPIRERWHDILPEVDSSEFDMLELQCKKLEDFALSLAEKVRNNVISDDVAREQLAQEYPILDQDRLDHTWSQAMYFSLK